MPVSSRDLLRQELGEATYQMHVEYHARDFRRNLEREQNEHTIQQRITSVSVVVSTAIALALTKNQLPLWGAVETELIVLIVGGAWHYAAQQDRDYYCESARSNIKRIMNAVPERLRLIAQAAIHESGMDEEKIPATKAKRGMLYLRKSFLHAIQTVAPHLASFFI